MASGPAAMDRAAGTAERASAADDEAAGIVRAKGAEHAPGVERALSLGKDCAPDVIAQRRSRDMEERHRDLRTTELRHDPRRVGIRREHRPFGTDAAAGGGEMPDAALARYPLDRTSREDTGSGSERRAGEAAHIGERLNRPGAVVEQSGAIGRGAGLGAEFLAFED